MIKKFQLLKMMENEAKIKRLPPEEIQKIAAGEVVERPASVLKELLENSLDAGATIISIFIEQAGKKLIRVVDNGCGMSRTDALMAFVPHATSKICSVDDLLSISSYGFRGEALASIASVSRATLITAKAGAENNAIKVECIAGIISAAEATISQSGCDFSIRDLFCSVPVRLKFLKKDETEWNQLYDLVQAVAFSAPGIHITLYRDNQVILNAPAVLNVLDRTRQIWEAHNASLMLSFLGKEGLECSVEGVISQPSVQRYNRSDILLFVNGRWVKNPHLMKAVLKGYAQSLPSGKFPMAVIFITIPQDRVDVNVHPRKEEVSFVSPGRVESALADSIKNALESSAPQAPAAQSFFPEVRSSAQYFVQNPFVGARDRDLFSPFENKSFERKIIPFSEFSDVVPRDLAFEYVSRAIEAKEVKLHEPSKILAQQTIFEEAAKKYEVVQPRICGQLFNTYILVEEPSYFVMIDQHAAHERILYERMKDGFERAASVELLFPEVVRLPHEACKALESVQDFFADRGIVFEPFGLGQIRVSAFLVDSARVDFIDFFSELAQLILQETSLNAEQLRIKIYEHVHSHAACKAAVKAGDVLSVAEMNQLLMDLQSAPNRHMCIHGRPTSWRIPKKDIEKHFRRI